MALISLIGSDRFSELGPGIYQAINDISIANELSIGQPYLFVELIEGNKVKLSRSEPQLSMLDDILAPQLRPI
jgi:hypothetical protein